MVTVTTTDPDGFSPLGAANTRMPYRSVRHEGPVIGLHQCFGVKDVQISGISAANDDRVIV